MPASKFPKQLLFMSPDQVKFASRTFHPLVLVHIPNTLFIIRNGWNKTIA